MTAKQHPQIDDARQWDADRIRQEYDQNPDLTINRLSRITGKSLFRVMDILKGES